jgi:hypothetical protein
MLNNGGRKMKTGLMMLAGALVLSACVQNNVERGVGFDNRAQPNAGMGGFNAPAPVQTGPIGGAIPAGDLAAAGIGQGGFGQTGGAAPLPGVRSSAGVAPMPVGNGMMNGGGMAPMQTASADPMTGVRSNSGISDEQNFQAVTGRETIESDAQRRQAAIAAQQVIAPQPLPQRPAETGPNIVEYALNAPNVRGQAWYSRSMLASQSRFERNCAAYATADDAQRDFLARGGPERDRLGLDPDGDGFACGWDPAPFQRAARN